MPGGTPDHGPVATGGRGLNDKDRLPLPKGTAIVLPNREGGVSFNLSFGEVKRNEFDILCRQINGHYATAQRDQRSHSTALIVHVIHYSGYSDESPTGHSNLAAVS